MVINHLLNGMILQVGVCSTVMLGFSWIPSTILINMTGQPTPRNILPPEIAGLMIRAYENPLVSLNKALLKKSLISEEGYVRVGGVG